MSSHQISCQAADINKVLLTGASGYIGKHIALELLNQGYEVRASVRSLSRSQEVIDAVSPHLKPGIDIATKLTFIELDLEKDAGWDAALSGVDVLMHTASPFPIASPDNEDDLFVLQLKARCEPYALPKQRV